MPDKFESGTPNIPGIIGLRAALLYLEKVGINNLYRREMASYAVVLRRFKGHPGRCASWNAEYREPHRRRLH